MRKIQIEFTVPKQYEKDYKDVHAQLVFEDFFCKVEGRGFKILFDSATQQKHAQDGILPGSSWDERGSVPPENY